MTAERSAKPVADKLGVKSGEQAVAINVPTNVQLALGKAFITQTGAPRTGQFDLVLYFATDKALLGKDLPGMAAALKLGGRLRIAYPTRTGGASRWWPSTTSGRLCGSSRASSPFPAGISGESDCVR